MLAVNSVVEADVVSDFSECDPQITYVDDPPKEGQNCNEYTDCNENGVYDLGEPCLSIGEEVEKMSKPAIQNSYDEDDFQQRLAYEISLVKGEKYSQDEVDVRIEEALDGMVSEEVAESRLNEAVALAMDGKVSALEVSQMVENAVAEATVGLISEEIAESQLNEAIEKVIATEAALHQGATGKVGVYYPTTNYSGLKIVEKRETALHDLIEGENYFILRIEDRMGYRKMARWKLGVEPLCEDIGGYSLVSYLYNGANGALGSVSFCQ